MEEIELYKLLGYIKVSPYRTKTLQSIDTNLKMLNEEVRKGRLYKCTELGLELLKYID